MLEKMLDKLKTINPWHFVWISIVCSEIITYCLSTLQGRLWWGTASRETLITGAVDSSVVPLIVASMVIFFVKRAAELKKINEQLEETNRKLQELDRLKTEFVTTVSHELRTPLTSVKAFTELLMIKPDMGQQRKTKVVECINAEADRLTRLISDLLDVAKIESGSMNWRMETLFIEDVIETAVTIMAPLFEDKGLSLNVEFSSIRSPLTGDRDRLTQVVTNILTNSLKFTKAGGAIQIVVRCEAGRVIVGISDTGVGIPETDLESIFEKFRRSDSEDTRGCEGSGLGLFIARQVIEQHGGRIWASNNGAGSTLTFSLPCSGQFVTFSGSGQITIQ